MKQDSPKHFSEYVVAGTALFVSLTTLLVYMYQAKVMKEQQHVSVWPYVEWTTGNIQDFHISAQNKGVGPALVREVEMKVDGKVVKNNREFVTAVLGPEWNLAFTHSALEGAVLLPGETRSPFVINDLTQGRAFEAQLLKHRFELHITYCSIYGDCWTTDGNQVRRLPKVDLGLY